MSEYSRSTRSIGCPRGQPSAALDVDRRRADTRNGLCRFVYRMREMWFDEPDDGVGSDGAFGDLPATEHGAGHRFRQVDAGQHERDAGIGPVQPAEDDGVDDVVVEPQPARGIDVDLAPKAGDHLHRGVVGQAHQVLDRSRAVAGSGGCRARR